MTREDIIKAAFKVWGRELYQTTSLAQIAGELGVSKPALYRHFRDKQALLNAMYTSFFDNYVSFVKPGYERALNAGNRRDTYLIMIRTVAEYYIRNSDAFIFSLFRVYSREDKGVMDRELRARGINMRDLVCLDHDTGTYPSKIQLCVVTLTFCTAGFHRNSHKTGEIPSEDQIRRVLNQMEERIMSGLDLDARKVEALDYEALEKRAAGAVYGETEENKLLQAVAEAVAEAGPWNASMEMVAKRSGLSKSGLYAHFVNKQDMVRQFFFTEFVRILNFAKAKVESSEVPEEQLYLAIVSVMQYLRSRPEILAAIDWLRTRRLDLEAPVSQQIYRIITDIKLEAIQKHDGDLMAWVAQWILFLIVNTLVWGPAKQGETGAPALQERRNSRNALVLNFTEVTNESCRILFRFIALGLDGFNL
ncbi:MAG: TetR/AcrR family transcriptional regulator [Treponema sp.]|nr:TetR/AcrR family transcriptional regulator [Treponema sp.]